MKKQIKFLLATLKYTGFFIVFFVLSKASINNVCFPFAFGALFALVWCNQKPLLLAPLFIAASLLASPTEQTLTFSIVTTFVCLVSYGLHFRFQKKLSPTLLGFYALLSQSVFMFISIKADGNIVLALAHIVLGTLFMFALIKVFEALLVKGISHKLNNTEIICAGILFCTFASGLNTVALPYFDLTVFIGILFVYIFYHIFESPGSFFIAIAFGSGTLLSTGSTDLIALLSLVSISMLIFKSQRKVLIALASLMSAAIFYVSTQGFSIDMILAMPSVLCAIGIFFLLPHKSLSKLQGAFLIASTRSSMRNIVNRSREALNKRLLKLSDVFGEMDKVFKQLVKGELSKDQVQKMLIDEAKLKVCFDCPEKNRCQRSYMSDNSDTMALLATKALERKTTLLDIPPFLTARCNRTNQLLSTMNSLSTQYKQYASLMTNIDSSRLLIAEQLGGVSSVMKKLASEVKANVSFDASRETKLINELSMMGIETEDIAVFEESVSSLSITIVLKNEYAARENLIGVCNKVFKSKLIITDASPSPIGGLTILTLNNAPKYELLLGSATQTKTGSLKSGDSFTITKLVSNKFLVALCDGMGSGAKAESASNLAIGLVENFYQAGFESDLILSSVNKLLLLGNEEVFSALDLCVLDLQNGVLDFVKLGSPISLIKRKYEMEILECESLPIGIVNEIQPTTKKTLFEKGDVVILCSDGIADSFRSADELSNFINNIESKNVQETADIIMTEAISICGGVALDDMTVLVIKII